MYRIEEGNAVKIMKELKPEDIDCVITDPPYRGFGLGPRFGAKDYWNRFKKFYDEMERLTDRISVSALLNFHYHLVPSMKMTDSVEIEDCFVDPNKKGIGAWFLTRNQLREQGEEQQWHSKIVPKSSHINARDINKMAIIVEAMTNEGDTVLDPFCGSAAIGVACVLLKRNFIGIELDHHRARDAQRRMKFAVRALTIKGE